MATGELATTAPVGVGWLGSRIGERTARGVAGTVSGLIRDGEVLPGTRLPTVRALAAELAVSPTTIAEAWSQLRAAGLIGTGRRRGTVVLEPPASPAPGQSFSGWQTVDLEHGLPDPALLPPLEDAVAAGVHAERFSAPAKHAITPQLRAAVKSAWPFPVESWTVAAGGHEGMLLACQAVARPGDVIALEEPTAPWLLELLRRSRIHVVPVRCDEHGPLPSALAAALEHRPVAFAYQPRAQTPLGHSVPDDRIAELAAVLSEVDIPVIEDDDFGPLASAPSRSLGTHLPGRVLLVRSYCTALGTELRSCVLGGPAPLVERVRQQRGPGSVWSSRILQDAQAFLLTDPGTGELLNRARHRYAQRRTALSEALREHGIEAPARDGLTLWVPVPEESRALITLAANGVSAGAGSRAGNSGLPHIRVATGQLPDDPALVADLARMIARASGRG
ncbi:aminotransferase class I/II-fold pyridoxal phosphate-dependent enzyme [Amycolatopsis jejuensis]|uniref:aminotransferase class I/II-fold pyridoxal phosphate-dependent enzyme n=1 Tax=Amycolatopsis jejuensis TaxID=330084 RepID=UPI0006910D7C|nr:PLP-dependent aminotransferase family protein [Amycolatopsis jejuensis]